jgi:drug/metabolite transporter (DMT)-like permease
MELWFFYAIIGSFFIGINNYLIKLIAERKIEGSIITFFQGLIYLTFLCCEALIRGQDFTLLTTYHPAIIYSALIASVVFLNLRFRVSALKYLSSSEYYIGYRIFLTALLVIIGLIFLEESISEAQLFSLVIGSVAIYFLFEEDARLRNSRNWRRAILFLGLSILAGVTIQVL